MPLPLDDSCPDCGVPCGNLSPGRCGGPEESERPEPEEPWGDEPSTLEQLHV